MKISFHKSHITDKANDRFYQEMIEKKKDYDVEFYDATWTFGKILTECTINLQGVRDYRLLHELRKQQSFVEEKTDGNTD